MPSTYSINIGLPTEAHRLAIIGDIDQLLFTYSVLSQLPDNEVKYIHPHYIRDAVYSVWENSIFKQTTGSASIEYIGIDRDDVFNNTGATSGGKIYFGKKTILGSEVMDHNLLTSDTDTFFFNNKSDSNPSQQSTKISIIAGTSLSLYGSAPYIRSRIATGVSSSQVIQLDIGNNSGNINIYSSNNRVYINDIGWPTIAETSASASNGKLLKYLDGNLYWDINIFTASSVGTSSATSSIAGNPVLINGYNIELTDSRPIISNVGSIKTNKTFSSESIVEVIREMLYSYIPPSCSLSVSPSISEKGAFVPIQVGWTIYKKTDPIVSAIFTSGNVIGFSTPAPINTPGSSVISSPPYVIGVPPVGFSSTYTFVVQDNGASNGYVPSTSTCSISTNLVYPYFWGVSAVNVTNPSQMNSILGTLTKSVTEKSNKSAAVSGTGYIYFAYPVASGGPTYGTLSQILDENTNAVAFTYSIYSGPGLTSPNSYWSNVPYYVYKIGPTTVGFPNPVTWTFNY